MITIAAAYLPIGVRVLFGRTPVTIANTAVHGDVVTLAATTDTGAILPPRNVPADRRYALPASRRGLRAA